jgi:heptosyltransferase II
MPSPRRPLIVRLRNWVGDVTLSVPALQRLDDAGYALQLIGKGWAADLLAGHGWSVHKQPGSFAERVGLLRRLHHEARATDPAFDGRLNALCLPDSFSSAIEFRLAGLRALGHAHEGRSLLLARTLPLSHTLHALQVYWRFADSVLGQSAPLPQAIGLRVTDAHRAQAQALRRAHGIESGCIVICPFAGGTWSQMDKTWPGFADLARSFLPTLGRSVVICPGPGEEAIAREHFAQATLLPDVGLGTYAALLQEAALMIANDTGPGHIAAAVGTPLVSVLGPSDPALWRAWGPDVQIVQGPAGWPEAQAVAMAAQDALRAR